MKKILCQMIINAPNVYISISNNPTWLLASQLEEEANTTERLLRTLLYCYNSAVEPQATTYHRVSRALEKAEARCKRRNVRRCVEMYRAMNRIPPIGHPLYHEVMEVLIDEGVML